MPAAILPWVITSVAAGFSGLLGFIAGQGASGIGDAVKYGVIGVIAYYAYKELMK
jgi:hypothetical protein